MPLVLQPLEAENQAVAGGSECRFNCLDEKGEIVHDGVQSCPQSIPDRCKRILLNNPNPCPKGTKLEVACYPV